MNLHAVLHIQNSPYAAAAAPNELRLRLRTARNDCKRVQLVIGNKYHWEGRQVFPMQKVLADRLFDYYQFNYQTDDPRLGYYFILGDGHRTVCYAEDGFSSRFDDANSYRHFFQFPFIHPGDILTVPGWMHDAVFYQIFVDSFCNGVPQGKPPGLTPWHALPDTRQMYGGDLAGIRKKLPYLSELGVNALYLTPIFQSPSNHRYDTTDYRKIDPLLGDLDTLKALVDAAHARGIRVVLDAVFNHCGYGFAPFQDLLENGAASPYRDWFFPHSLPVRRFTPEEYSDWRRRPHPSRINYRVFGGSPGMPKLNTTNPELRQYLCDTALYWMREANIDGWRLDVSDEVDHDFWRVFRQVVKAENPEAVIIGENWHDAAAWLRGDQFDGVMNYAVTKCCIDFFADRALSAHQFAADLSAVLARNSDNANFGMLNLLGSHDTARFLTLCGGNKARLRLALMFLFCFVGTPCIYYGDEVGMDGDNDPGCRKSFNWDEATWDTTLLGFCRQLVALRGAQPALQQGTVRLFAQGALFGMVRHYNGERVICLLNNTDFPQEALLPTAAHQPLIPGSAPPKGQKVLLPPLTGGIYRAPHHPGGQSTPDKGDWQ